MTQKSSKSNPIDRTNFISQLCFCWLLPYFFKGYQKVLTEDDMYKNRSIHDSEMLGNKLELVWIRKKSLGKALISMFIGEFVWICLLSMITETFKITQPFLLLRLLTIYDENRASENTVDLYTYAILLIISILLGVLSFHYVGLVIVQLGMKMRIACSSLIYRKALKLNQTALTKTSAGQIVNLLSNDVRKLEYTSFTFMLFLAPTEAIVVMVLIYLSVGWYGLLGAVCFLISMLFTSILGKIAGKLRFATAQITDKRISWINEILSGIEVVKMFAWETFVGNQVEATRKPEIQQLSRNSIVRGLSIFTPLAFTKLAIFSAVVLYILTGNVLKSSYVFTLTAFYRLLQSVTVSFPIAATTFAEMVISIKRIQEYLCHEDYARTQNLQMPLQIVKKTTDPRNSSEISKLNGEIELFDVSAKWPNSASHSIRNISIKITSGELTTIIGSSGCGKTTLLNVILQELSPHQGSVMVSGTISYAPQEPWLFGETLRENILFGQPYIENKYRQVVKVCALERDFKLFQYGDGTMTGETGLSLSGGQRARINLARAIYRDADIYLLDDPLSAVDNRVGKHIFELAILDYLRNKTVVLVTHQLQYLKNVNSIHLLKEGSLEHFTSYSQLKEHSKEYLNDLDDIINQEEEQTEESVIAGEIESKNVVDLQQKVMKEEKSKGKISGKVYKMYFSASGHWFRTVLMFSVFVIAQALDSMSEYFLGYWPEIQQLSRNSIVRGLSIFTPLAFTKLAIFSAVVLYILTGNVLKSSYVFTLTAFYRLLQSVTVSFPIAATTFAEMVISIKRIQEYLCHEDYARTQNLQMPLQIVKKTTDPRNSSEISKLNGEIELFDVSAKWPNSASHSIRNISIKITSGELTTIIGSSGCGKTTLLNVILQELSPHQGSVMVSGTISYAPQEPWLFGETLRENILFGQPYIENKYRQVVKVCALERDFKLFQYGDGTMTGETGLSLSGGQRARINLARAIYRDADIYLLDDPLSAVDNRVGKHIFELAILDYLRNKTVVLVTHQLQYLKNVNSIHLLKEGSLEHFTSYSQLKEHSKEYLNDLDDIINQEEEQTEESVIAGEIESKNVVDLQQKVMKEEMSKGKISGKVYKMYFSASGHWFRTVLMFSVFVIAQALDSMSEYFLGYWPEIQQLSRNSIVRGLSIFTPLAFTKLAIFSAVVLYILTGNVLKSSYVFTLTAFYRLLQSVTVSFPIAATTFAEMVISIKRIQEYLCHEDYARTQNLQMPLQIVKKTTDPRNSSEISKLNGEIELFDVSAKWPNSASHSIRNISIKITSGELTTIIGSSGCGKTTLLNVILQELSPHQGSVMVSGTISYAPQEPWLFGETLRENILFGQPYIENKYRQVVKVCALERDFKLFQYGDGTMTGETGLSLSGGQRARINLARAIYRDADIYLLDDPLSAVDNRVGKHIFELAILDYLRNKTVVLVTHQLQYLKNVNSIHLLKEGSLEHFTSYSQLKEHSKEYLNDLDDIINQEEEQTEESVIAGEIESKNVVDLQQKVMKEEMSKGKISGKVYKMYFSASGHWFRTVLMFSVFVIAQALDSMSEYFLGYWINIEQDKQIMEKTTSQSGLKERIQINETIKDNHIDWCIDMIFGGPYTLIYYTILVLLFIFFTLTRSIYFYLWCVRISERLHKIMFNKVGITMISIYITIGIVNFWTLVPSIVMFCLSFHMRNYYLDTSRDITRIESISRAPMFTHLTQSLQGITVIRTFNVGEKFKKEFHIFQNLHSSAFFMSLASSRTYGFWIDMLSSIYVCCVTFFLLIIKKESFGGNVGFALSQALWLTQALQKGMRQWGEFENKMISVERIQEYIDLEPENDNKKEPSKVWPLEGKIEYREVSLKYSKDSHPALTEVNITIEPNEKIGIVGRTGAGKSSLLRVLLRLVDFGGSVFIDGVNCESISLRALRKKISVISQVPLLFSGSLRNNLDPFEEHDDEILWKALEEVEMKHKVEKLSNSLNMVIAEGGSNFSIGERQLLCLARAIINHNKILFLDEATSNVDPQTDNLIQKTIRLKFSDCTVLTIAHRLQTVMNSDRVLVMDNGKVVEFDCPEVLLKKKDGYFYSLVMQAGHKDGVEHLRVEE